MKNVIFGSFNKLFVLKKQKQVAPDVRTVRLSDFVFIICLREVGAHSDPHSLIRWVLGSDLWEAAFV